MIDLISVITLLLILSSRARGPTREFSRYDTIICIILFYSLYHKAPRITLLLQPVHKGNNANNHAIICILSGVPRQIEHPLFHLMHYYNTILSLFDYIHIIT